jgi:hypothetical protein
MSSVQILDYVTRVVLAVNQHWHKETCKKGDRRGDDTDCRMDYIRLLVSISHVLPDGNSLLLRRTQGNLVPYLRALMMACPSNHTMQLTCEASRWRRQYHLWQKAVAAGDTQVCTTPASPPY